MVFHDRNAPTERDSNEKDMNENEHNNSGDAIDNSPDENISSLHQNLLHPQMIAHILQTLPSPNDNIFSLTQYLNQITSYIHLLHAYRQRRSKVVNYEREQQAYRNAGQGDGYANTDYPGIDSMNDSSFPADASIRGQEPEIDPKDQQWFPLIKPFLFYHKFQLAKQLYLRDLRDAIQSLDIRQKIAEKQVERLYERVANYQPYRQTPRYAPLYWIFGQSWGISPMNTQAQSSPYSKFTQSPSTDSLSMIPSMIHHIPMSESLREMLLSRPSLQEGTYGQSWGVYSVQVREPSLVPNQDQEWVTYPELDQLMERNFLLKSALHALRETWSQKYYNIHRGAPYYVKQRLFEQWCFNLLNDREKRIRRLIQILRSGELKDIRRYRSLYVSQYNQLSQLNLPHLSKIDFFK